MSTGATRITPVHAIHTDKSNGLGKAANPISPQGIQPQELLIKQLMDGV